MQELKHAIQEAHGVTALARALGVSQSRVSNWLTRGSVPDGWLQVIRMRYPMPDTATAHTEAEHG